MASRESELHLFQALEAHKFELENSRDLTSGQNLDALDRRIAAAELLLETLSQALKLEPLASPEVRGPPSSDQDQTPAHPAQASRRWISHSGDASTGA